MEIAFFSLEVMADTVPPWLAGAGAAPCAKALPAPIARDNSIALTSDFIVIFPRCSIRSTPIGLIFRFAVMAAAGAARRITALPNETVLRSPRRLSSTHCQNAIEKFSHRFANETVFALGGDAVPAHAIRHFATDFMAAFQGGPLKKTNTTSLCHMGMQKCTNRLEKYTCSQVLER